MSSEEVKQIEEENGVDVYYADVNNGEKVDHPTDWIKANTTVAGLSNTSLGYRFTSEHLYTMYYVFEETTDLFEKYDFTGHYNTIEQGLVSKYGETVYSSDTMKTVPTYEPRIQDESNYVGTYLFTKVEGSTWSQRILFLDSGEAVFIEHSACKVSRLTNIDENIYTDEVQHELTYTLVPVDKASTILNLLSGNNSDL